jgi:hypothetical protein
VTQEEAVALVLDALESSGIDYMVVGSFAGNLHGAPRTTHDAGVVIEPSERAIRAALERLRDDFYVSDDAVTDALRRRTQFNVIHFESGMKIDLIVRKDRRFSETELHRRTRGPLAGRTVPFATAEDTFLTKLEWSRKSSSERQFLDACGIAQVQAAASDWDYATRWAPELGVSDLLERARETIRAR